MAGPCIRALSVCLLNHSSAWSRLCPHLPLGHHTHSPLQGSPLRCNSAQPTASGENTSRERQEDIQAQHKRPGVSSRTGGHIHLLDDKGDWSTSSAGRWGKPITLLRLSFLLCTMGMVPVSDPPACNEMTHRKGLAPCLAKSKGPANASSC